MRIAHVTPLNSPGNQRTGSIASQSLHPGFMFGGRHDTDLESGPCPCRRPVCGPHRGRRPQGHHLDDCKCVDVAQHPVCRMA